MRILVTGADGQLGKALRSLLQQKECLVLSKQEMDVTSQSSTLKIITEYKPHVVIHTASYNAVDAAETNMEQAYLVNVVGTQNVAAACLACNAKLVSVSTDYVFDGSLSRMYTEFDTPNPLGVYGKSKLAGEVIAKQIVNRSFIIRTSWLYGEGKNFVRTILQTADKDKKIKVVSDQFGCPTYALDLATAILRLIPTEHYGTYHISNGGIVSWHGFAQKIIEIKGLQDVAVFEQTTAELGRPALRPAYTPLANMMLKLTIGYEMRHWEVALREYLSIHTDLNVER